MKHLKLIALISVSFLFGCGDPVSTMSPVALKCEYRINPVGIDQKEPRLSWIIEGSGKDRKQTAFQILVAASEYDLELSDGLVWNSGLHVTDRTTNIPYRGTELESNTTYYWKVRVWDEEKIQSEWSQTASFTTSLIDGSEWQATWIGYDQALSDNSIKPKPWANGMTQRTAYKPLPCPHLRTEFNLDELPDQALIHATALGLYQIYINGSRVGNDHFTPGWTDYNQRLYYNSYNVRKHLKKGINTIAVVLGDGWYAGVIGVRGQNFYGDKLRFKAQLHGDNSVLLITDESWKASYGPILESDIQGGETYDARLETSGWNKNDFDDSAWSKVDTGSNFKGLLAAYPANPVTNSQEIIPVEIREHDDGRFIVDMGQNFAGWAKLKVQGNKGDSVVMRFAEALTEEGELYTRNLRTARCTDTYVLKGEEPESFEPHFTYHGFRYVEVSGFPGSLTKENITGVVVQSRLNRTGHFSCSNDALNKLFENVMWSQRSNFFEVPTDCPQRDERLGWTGDAQVFSGTAAYNMDISAFYSKWIADIFDGQFTDGRLPSTAPRIYKRVAAGWGDAGIIIPWQFHLTYDDTNVLHDHFDEMENYMAYLLDTSDAFIGKRGSYGDWQNVESETPIDVIATAYHKHCADLMVKISKVLRKDQKAVEYDKLSVNIKSAFSYSLVDDSGFVKGRTQTGYLMAIAFDLVDERQKEQILDNLVEDITIRDTTLSTGILGTHLLLPVLTSAGHMDLAYALLLQENYPSWGYQIKNGASTMWERWDSYSDEKGMNSDSTNSLNHYAYGSVVEWMYSTIAGIQPLSPGYSEILIAPQPGGGLESAKGSYESIKGMISSEWSIESGEFLLKVSIPSNTRAEIQLPDGSERISVGSGEHEFTLPYSSEIL